jgi:hypothetical protein
MAARKPHSTPISAIAEEGQVLLEGPPGLALALTPKAARESAPALMAAADEAAKQLKKGSTK